MLVRRLIGSPLPSLLALVLLHFVNNSARIVEPCVHHVTRRVRMGQCGVYAIIIITRYDSLGNSSAFLSSSHPVT